MKKISFLVLISLLSSMFAGCAVLLVGVGAAGAIAISDDSASLEKDVYYNRAWKYTLKTLEKMGSVSMKDKDAGTIKARVREANISCQVSKITPKTTKIEIRARKTMLPDVDLAVEILNRIDERL